MRRYFKILPILAFLFKGEVFAQVGSLKLEQVHTKLKANNTFIEGISDTVLGWVFLGAVIVAVALSIYLWSSTWKVVAVWFIFFLLLIFVAIANGFI